MTSGSALVSGFNDFAEATGPAYISGPKDVINDAGKQRYGFGHLVADPRGYKKMIDGGQDIRTTAIFDDTATFEFYLPGAFHAWKEPQRLKKVRTYWRFAMAHMTWRKQEILLNQQIKYGDRRARFQAYVALRDEKEMLMWTDKWNGMENALWAVPNSARMEDEDGDGNMAVAYSILAWVNEWPLGLWGNQVDTSGATPVYSAANGVDATHAFTTKGGLNPTKADEAKFAPQRRFYDSVAVNDPGNIFGQLDLLSKDVIFETPPSHKEYFTDPRWRMYCITTTKAGHTAYQQLLREHTQDGFATVVGAQDPAFPDPSYYGAPVKWVDTLNEIKAYHDEVNDVLVTEKDGSGSVAANVATSGGGGPRFYLTNSMRLFPVFHDTNYFDKDEVSKHHNVPDTFVLPCSTWYNIHCSSLRRQGVLAPAAGSSLYQDLYA